MAWLRLRYSKAAACYARGALINRKWYDSTLTAKHLLEGACKRPILSPREEYERITDVGNVCFVSGAVLSDNGDMKIYYGAADTSICIATCTLNQILEDGF